MSMPSTSEFYDDDPPMVRAAMPIRARLWLALVTIGLIAVFSVAAWLHPYDEAGRPLRMRTHTQLGLRPCNFEVMTGEPCPSCGMTTSFSLLIHGDMANSLRANWVGTVAALFGLGALVWSGYSTWRARYVWIRPSEVMVLSLAGIFAVLMLVRWGTLMLMPDLQM